MLFLSYLFVGFSLICFYISEATQSTTFCWPQLFCQVLLVFGGYVGVHEIIPSSLFYYQLSHIVHPFLVFFGLFGAYEFISSSLFYFLVFGGYFPVLNDAMLSIFETFWILRRALLDHGPLHVHCTFKSGNVGISQTNIYWSQIRQLVWLQRWWDFFVDHWPIMVLTMRWLNPIIMRSQGFDITIMDKLHNKNAEMPCILYIILYTEHTWSTVILWKVEWEREEDTDTCKARWTHHAILPSHLLIGLQTLINAS